MRTLVISDLHLGGRAGRDVARAPVPRARLLTAIADVERLVLLGDVVELLEARPDEAMALAEPVLRDIGAAVGPGREVVVVPGNHDRHLIRDWLREDGRELTSDTVVPPHAGYLLEHLVAMLGAAGATVTVRYPGVWLGERVWATHGHYLDRHLLPESAFGIARGLLGRLPRDGAAPMEYEQRQSLTSLEGPLTRWLPRWAIARIDDLVAAARRATMAGTQAMAGRSPGHHWVTTARGHLLGLQMRRASIPALARVVHRLGIDADDVVFGHVHRLGPRSTDTAEQWTGPGGVPRIWNTGSWVHESLLLHRMRPPHPYWPGGAVLVHGDGRIEPLMLLEDVAAEDLDA
ncbi:metallophosphoesterase [Paraconexibacter sp.]|uniref:metallophosphoesterase n=1 Tax=Paraconexibacter sp. TaxID=2949640 RepID=UPI003567A97A